MPYDFRARLGNTYEVAFCEVASSAYDLFELAFTCIYHADPESVSVWMRLYLFDLSCDYVVELICCICNSFYLNSPHCQVVSDLIICKIGRQIDKLL